MTANEISKKYDPVVVSMALCTLLDNGVRHISEEKIRAEIKAYAAEDSDGKITAPHIQAQVLECALEFSRLQPWDILKFVRGYFQINGLKVHPGYLLEVRVEGVAAPLFRGYLPPDTSNEMLEKLEQQLEEAKGALVKKAPASREALRREIPRVLRSNGIPFEPDDCDGAIYL